jgi:hypothetical protein
VCSFSSELNNKRLCCIKELIFVLNIKLSDNKVVFIVYRKLNV